MLLPKTSGIYYICRKKTPERWSLALFYWNGKTPIWAQYGSEINDVVKWKPYVQKQEDAL